MSKKEKYSNAGKGDKSRVTDKKKYAENWEKIFGKTKKDKKMIDNIAIAIYFNFIPIALMVFGSWIFVEFVKNEHERQRNEK